MAWALDDLSLSVLIKIFWILLVWTIARYPGIVRPNARIRYPALRLLNKFTWASVCSELASARRFIGDPFQSETSSNLRCRFKTISGSFGSPNFHWPSISSTKNRVNGQRIRNLWSSKSKFILVIVKAHKFRLDSIGFKLNHSNEPLGRASD